MELRQLRYFVGASESGSLLKASAMLHVAQPALSQQIAALEDEIGARLFDRSSRGVTLTDAGRTFLEHARIVLADVERARAAVREVASTPSGEVVVGLPTTVALAATVHVVQRCRAQFPQVRLRIVEGYSGHLREWLLQGRLDLAVLYGDATEPGLAKRLLLEEKLVLVSAGRSVGGSSAPARLPLAQIATRPMILPSREHGLRRIIDEVCAAHGLQLDIVAEIDALPSVKRAVETGLGCTVLPVGAVGEEIALGKLQVSMIERPSLPRRLVCATSVARPGTRAATAVTGAITDVMREMVDAGQWPARWIGS